MTGRAMTRRQALLAPLAAARREKWNVVVATGDNVGYHDLGCYGSTANLTPHLDRFAREGVRFTNFYTSSPTCTASRAGLLTGRHPLRYGLNYQLSARENQRGIGLPHREKLVPEYLRPLGYATACFGKWNLGFAPGSRPTERGFDEFLGIRSGNINYYTYLYGGEMDMYRGVEPAKVEGYSTDLFAGAAVDFIRRNASRPFFLYLPFNAPHFPSATNFPPGETPTWQAPAEYFERYGYSPRETDRKMRFQAVLTALDDAFGRVMRAIGEAGLSERTLVLFYSDNGAFMLPGRGLEEQSNAPLRDGGVTCWEGGIRVAGMAQWPGRSARGTTCAELLSAHDVLPLAMRLAGGRLPGDRAFDGADPLPALEGKARSGHQALYFEWGKQQAVRSGRWKLIRDGRQAPWQLYDLERDAGETRDVASREAERVRELGRMFEEWRAGVEGTQARA
jgi:arylsulfatase A